MEKKKFIQTIEHTAIRFDPKEHPYHRSIQRVTVDGEIPDFERYLCIIPMERADSIDPGDWIIVDDMDNAKGVLHQSMMNMMNIKPAD